jgi:hypothetical protein
MRRPWRSRRRGAPGCTGGNTTTAVPSRIRRVIEAQCATIINGDAHKQ